MPVLIGRKDRLACRNIRRGRIDNTDSPWPALEILIQAV